MNNIITTNKPIYTTLTKNINKINQPNPITKLAQNSKYNLGSTLSANEAKNTILKEAIECVKSGKSTLKEALQYLKNKIGNI